MGGGEARGRLTSQVPPEDLAFPWTLDLGLWTLGEVGQSDWVARGQLWCSDLFFEALGRETESLKKAGWGTEM